MSNKEIFSGGFGAKLTDFQRGYAKALYDLGQTAAQMAERMKFSNYIIKDQRLKIGSDDNCYFQHDRATSHTAKATQQYLKDNNVNVIEWPPKGADLCPIELCFGEIQRKMKQFYSEIKTKDALWEKISEMVFLEDFTSFVKKCYDTMQKRWKQAVDSEGGITNY